MIEQVKKGVTNIKFELQRPKDRQTFALFRDEFFLKVLPIVFVVFLFESDGFAHEY